MMTIKNFIAILGLLLFTNNIAAQSTKDSDTQKESVDTTSVNPSIVSPVPNDYTKQLEDALKKKTDLEKKKKDLQTALTEAKGDVKKLSKQMNTLKSDLSKLQSSIAQLKEKQKATGYSELCTKKAQLEALITNNKENLANLTQELSVLDTQLGESDSKKAELEKVKQEVSTKLIVENESYVEQPFSTLTTDGLKQVLEKCQPYTTDQKVNAFVVKVNGILKSKAIFDEIQKTLNSPFQKSSVLQALSKIQSMQNLSATQKAEISMSKKQLEAFEAGLAAFKEFINNLNKCREGVNYSIQFFQDDKSRIFRNDLEQRINTKLLPVPYLKTKYEAFMKEFKKAPSKHSEIEAEILNQ